MNRYFAVVALAIAIAFVGLIHSPLLYHPILATGYSDERWARLLEQPGCHFIQCTASMWLECPFWVR